MKSLALAIATASLLASGVGIAQTTQGTRAGETAPAVSGNSNQVVATTSANAAMPAKGANSFTMGEARSRIEKNGFSNVSDLAKDNDGIWRGKAQKGDSTTAVWLDYKGNVGANP